MPFAAGSFDGVMLMETIEHVPDTDHLLAEVRRVTRPGGDLILTFPNIRTPIGLLMLALGLPPMFAATYRSVHVRDFTLRTVRAALANHGFKIQRCIGLGFCVSRHPAGILHRLSVRFPAWSSRVLMHATKEG
jgi:2-polyprenyl-3-methyl-5-hydroxy-6-metoxy-1,4-benzoquinol methylase